VFFCGSTRDRVTEFQGGDQRGFTPELFGVRSRAMVASPGENGDMQVGVLDGDGRRCIWIRTGWLVLRGGGPNERVSGVIFTPVVSFMEEVFVGRYLDEESGPAWIGLVDLRDVDAAPLSSRTVLV